MTKRLVVDCETTGLDPDRHQIWELAVIELAEDGTRTEHLWRMLPDLPRAEPGALTIGRFYPRTASTECAEDYGLASGLYDLAGGADQGCFWSDPLSLARRIAHLFDGATLIGAVPSFDAGFLRAFLAEFGQAGTWHYRLRDIGSMAYGALHGFRLGAVREIACRGISTAPKFAVPDIPPINAGTDDFAKALGVDLSQFERHSALGDCRLVLAMLDVIEGRT